MKTRADIRRGVYVKWNGDWYRVAWFGRTRFGDLMLKCRTLPASWPDREVWLKPDQVTAVRATSETRRAATAELDD